MNALSLDVWLPHPPERLAVCFDDAFLLRRWYGAPPGAHRVYSSSPRDSDEDFTLQLVDDHGLTFLQHGRILERTEERLVLEMHWSGGELEGASSQATLTLHPTDGGTRIRVEQGPFSHPEQREGHRAYWEYCLGRLARVAGGEAVPCFEEFMEESKGFREPLGVAAYTVLAGLRESGMAPEALARLEETLYEHLGRLPPETARVLVAVLRARVTD